MSESRLPGSLIYTLMVSQVMSLSQAGVQADRWWEVPLMDQKSLDVPHRTSLVSQMAIVNSAQQSKIPLRDKCNMPHLHHLINERGVQVAGNEACPNPLDLVSARGPSRDDRALCGLHCHNLQGHQKLC